MKIAENKMKTVLSDTIIALCRNMLSQHGHVQIDGLLGITVNHQEIFLVNISRTISNLLEVKAEAGAVDIADNEQSEGNDEADDVTNSPLSPKKPRKRGRRKKTPDKSSTFIDDSNDLPNAMSNSDLHNDSVESGSHAESMDDSRDADNDNLNLSDSQAMLDVYGNLIDNQSNCNIEKPHTFSVSNDKDSGSYNLVTVKPELVDEQLVVKTEVLSDGEQELNQNSSTPNVQWPVSLSAMLAPTGKVPSLHLPNISNLVSISLLASGGH